MNIFFALLAEEKINEWIDVLDWLFSEDRFPSEKGWDKNSVAGFTKKIKKLQGLSKERFVCASRKNIQFLDYSSTKNRPKLPIIQMTSGGSIGKAVVKHIRNSIAHGHAKIVTYKGNKYFEAIDKKGNKEQSAYMFLPLDYIITMHEIYNEIEQSLKPGVSSHKTKKAKSTIKCS